jgi:uncharacterized protein DUF3435
VLTSQKDDIFHERDDNLALCPISHFLALADDAFEAQGIDSPEDIFRIAVPSYRNSLRIRWKPDMLDISSHRSHRAGYSRLTGPCITI